MRRTASYKAIYFAVVFGGAALLAAFAFSLRIGAVGVVAAILLLLLPGRVLGFFWRDLLRGLHLLNAGEYAESKRHSERFIIEVREKPWLKRLIWLGTSSYSRDPEALALNNLGAAEAKLGEFDAARRHLLEALAIDKLNPLPYFNLGAVHAALGETQEAERLRAEAARLGYRRDLSDRIVMASQTRFAATDGTGETSSKN